MKNCVNLKKRDQKSNFGYSLQIFSNDDQCKIFVFILTEPEMVTVPKSLLESLQSTIATNSNAIINMSLHLEESKNTFIRLSELLAGKVTTFQCLRVNVPFMYRLSLISPRSIRSHCTARMHRDFSFSINLFIYSQSVHSSLI